MIRWRNQYRTRFDDVENRQKYHEVLLKNQQWKYSAPYPNKFSIGEHRVLDQMKKIGGRVNLVSVQLS